MFTSKNLFYGISASRARQTALPAPKLLTKDEARPIAANVVKLPKLLSHKTPRRQFIVGINIDCIAR
jgi:hypothetical protein